LLKLNDAQIATWLRETTRAEAKTECMLIEATAFPELHEPQQQAIRDRMNAVLSDRSVEEIREERWAANRTALASVAGRRSHGV